MTSLYTLECTKIVHMCTIIYHLGLFQTQIRYYLLVFVNLALQLLWINIPFYSYIYLVLIDLYVYTRELEIHYYYYKQSETQTKTMSTSNTTCFLYVEGFFIYPISSYYTLKLMESCLLN